MSDVNTQTELEKQLRAEKNELAERLATAEGELAHLREKFYGGTFAPDMDILVYRALVSFPGSGHLISQQLRPKNIAALVEVINGLSEIAQKQFNRADEAENELLGSIDDMFAAFGEMMHRASETAKIRRDRRTGN